MWPKGDYLLEERHFTIDTCSAVRGMMTSSVHPDHNYAWHDDFISSSVHPDHASFLCHDRI
jgi:hypothetical protein